jgi:choline dehydrogenase-like flavoprotein
LSASALIRIGLSEFLRGPRDLIEEIATRNTMARKLPRKDVAIIGLGWTGSILAQELTDEGLDVVAIERGPWRDTASDFLISYAQDEWRYRLQHELFLRPAQTTVTFRNNANQTSLPVRNEPVRGASLTALSDTGAKAGLWPCLVR